MSTPTLHDFRDRLTEGVRFNYCGFYANGKPQPTCYFDYSSDRWEVERVVDRGVVVSHPSNKGHQHLLEWSKPIAGIKFA
jgi:hypothetical protein